MALANIEIAKLLLVPSPFTADQQSYNLLQFLLDTASASIEDYVGYPLTYQSRVEYYSGNGMPDIVLKRFPTDSAADNFVWVDLQGAWGQRAGSFADTTLLVQGLDYAIVTEQDGTKGKSGLLRRLSQTSALGVPGGGGNGWGWFGGGLMGGQSTLTPINWHYPNWLQGEGNVKVQYFAGFQSDAIPQALQQACMNLAAWLKRNSPLGGMTLTSEGLSEYNYSLGNLNAAQIAGAALAAAGELGSTRQLLSRYRDLAA